MNEYVRQSKITDPGAYAHLYDNLPTDNAALLRVVQGLVTHFANSENGYRPAKERLIEVDSRYVPDMLRRIIELDDRPLTEARPVEKRLVGCCRDFAVLFASMARHQGKAVRTRVGFAAYFVPNFYADHVVVEHWHEGRWHLIDAQIKPTFVGANGITFDTHDIPRDLFVNAGQAWQMCRTGTVDPKWFAVNPGDPEYGLDYIRASLLQDLAALNRMEMLQWDLWGLAVEDCNEADFPLLDRVAAVLADANVSLETAQTLYHEDLRLRIGSSVQGYSPAQGAYALQVTAESFQ